MALHAMKYSKTFVLTILVCTICCDSRAIEHHKVIVIGAGSSGIAAATKLLENHVYDLVVLEAENRYGGRINTTNFGNSFVELGAEWCHGEEGNVVYEMMKDYDVFRQLNYSVNYIYSNGEKVDEDIHVDLERFFYKVDEFEITDSDKKKSCGEFLLEHYEKEILEKYKDDPRKLKIAVDAISTLEATLLTDDGAFSWFNKSAESHFESPSGSYSLTWDGVGYRTIIEIMMKTFERRVDTLGIKRKILYGKKVFKIKWQNAFSNVVTVWCTDGSTYTAEHVIFTPSLGVLKASHKDLFIPTLPPKKIEAIESLGFDGVMKIITHFPSVWWQSDGLIAQFVWSSEDKVNMRMKFPEGPMQDGVSWITRIVYVHRAENNPNALIAWATGDIIPQIERAPIDVIKRGIMYVFDKFLGKEFNITEPDAIIRSSWCTNPNFRGTYSFETVTSIKLDYNCNEELSEPLRNSSGVPVLLFAGEATNSKHYGTVNGAIESGYREADRLLNVFKYHDKWKILKSINL